MHIKKESFNCMACGRDVYCKPKEVKVQYKYRNNGPYHHYYYRYCKICTRCWFLRILSVFIGIVGGGLYCLLFAKMMDTESTTLKIIYILLLNPLFVGVFICGIFRVLTKCHIDLDENANLKP